MPPNDDWFARANPADLDALAQSFETGRLVRGREHPSAVQALNLDHPDGLLEALRAMPGADGAATAWFLRRLAGERRAAHDHLAAAAQLVWSGPHDAHQPVRDTRTVLDELFARADVHVLVATYAIHQGRRSLGALAARMRDRPSLTVDLYTDLKGPTDTAAAEAWLLRFRREHWPEDVRLPTVWYSPSTVAYSAHTSLHAKCVAVDARWALVTSANFTGAAQERNFELGVVLDHRGLARTLVGQFQGLRDLGIFRALPA